MGWGGEVGWGGVGWGRVGVCVCVCVAKPVAVELRCHATALIEHFLTFYSNLRMLKLSSDFGT